MSRQGCLNGRSLHSAWANSRLFLGRRPNASHQTYPGPPGLSQPWLPGYLDKRSTIRVTNRAPVEFPCQMVPEYEAPPGPGAHDGHADSDETARKRSVPGGVATRRSCPAGFGPCQPLHTAARPASHNRPGLPGPFKKRVSASVHCRQRPAAGLAGCRWRGRLLIMASSTL